MSMRTLYLLTFAGNLTVALVAGCGGKVIVDGVGNDDGQGGQGGQGGQDGQGGNTSYNSSGFNVGSGVPACGFPEPSGNLVLCESTSSGSGGTNSCRPVFCDEDDNRYQSDCTDTSCICSFVSADRSQSFSCTCMLASSCVSATPCCPYVPFSPFP